jgi:hypothetical protein
MPCRETISVGADTFHQPIAVIADRLRQASHRGIGVSLPNAHERDYATTLILLSVVMFEAYLGRVRHFDGATPRRRRSGFDYFNALRGRRSKRLVDRVKEVFVLRDVIAHGHVWVQQQCWTPSKPAFLKSATLDLRLYGDARFKERVQSKMRSSPHEHLVGASPRTKSLKLHVVPTAIGRDDASKVLGAVIEGLRWLEKRGHLHLPVGYTDNIHVRFNGQLSFRFVDLPDCL